MRPRLSSVPDWTPIHQLPARSVGPIGPITESLAYKPALRGWPRGVRRSLRWLCRRWIVPAAMAAVFPARFGSRWIASRPGRAGMRLAGGSGGRLCSPAGYGADGEESEWRPVHIIRRFRCLAKRWRKRLMDASIVRKPQRVGSEYRAGANRRERRRAPENNSEKKRTSAYGARRGVDVSESLTVSGTGHGATRYHMTAAPCLSLSTKFGAVDGIRLPGRGCCLREPPLTRAASDSRCVRLRPTRQPTQKVGRVFLCASQPTGRRSGRKLGGSTAHCTGRSCNGAL